MKFIPELLSIFICFSVISLSSCNNKRTLFQQISSAQSGIHFNNKITESDSINPMDVVNIYNGGGVGIGDFNKDGLKDIIYTCGDNADYSMVLKPYHGVYIFLNEGESRFHF